MKWDQQSSGRDLWLTSDDVCVCVCVCVCVVCVCASKCLILLKGVWKEDNRVGSTQRPSSLSHWLPPPTPPAHPPPFHTDFMKIWMNLAIRTWEKAMAPHSSTLAWRIPGMGEPGGLPSMGSHRVWRDLAAAAAAAIRKTANFFWGNPIIIGLESNNKPL